MTEFISLDEFLNLPEQSYLPGRSFYHNRTGRDWSAWYKRAKQSYDQYGNEGPPIDSLVQTLVAGHGGAPGIVRKFGGVYELDSRFFFIYREAEGIQYSIEKSLVDRLYWWRDIFVIDNKRERIFLDL